MTAINEIQSGEHGEYVVDVARGAALHALMINGGRRYTSREVIVVDAENMQYWAERGIEIGRASCRERV